MYLPNGSCIPLEYDKPKYKMFLACRAPSQDELKNLPVQWVSCHIRDLLMDKEDAPIRRESVKGQDLPLAAPTVENESDSVELTDTENLGDVANIVVDAKHSTDKELSVTNSALKSPDTIVTTIAWGEIMGLKDSEVKRNTIKNTTQFYPCLVESEVREYPRQHRQKRLHALHFRGIPGKTCADIFFSPRSKASEDIPAFKYSLRHHGTMFGFN